jgi:hypothetical protein
MTPEAEIPSLSSLETIPYLDLAGHLPAQLQAKVGVYAIFSADRTLQYVGYSRDVLLSLRQHLVRQPAQCHWLKVQMSDRPNRTQLEAIRTAWIAENGSTPPGNGADANQWNQAIDAKLQMTAEEQAAHATALDELTQSKILKQVARRIEAKILETLKERGVQEEIRFNPKLKDSGLLDLK